MLQYIVETNDEGTKIEVAPLSDHRTLIFLLYIGASIIDRVAILGIYKNNKHAAVLPRLPGQLFSMCLPSPSKVL